MIDESDRLKLITYPLDGSITNEADAAPLAHADRVVVHTEFGCGTA